MIIEAYDISEQETSPCDRTNNVELETVAVPNTLTRQANSSSALHPPDETDGSGLPKFFKCELNLYYKIVGKITKYFVR